MSKSSESAYSAALEPEIHHAILSRVDQELARRAVSGSMMYFVGCLAVGFATPYLHQHPAALITAGAVMLVLGGMRFLSARRVASAAGGAHQHDVQLFRFATYACFAAWGVFSAQTVRWYGGEWTDLLVLLCTAALAGGASSSLAPDLVLARRCLALLIAPAVLAVLSLGEWRYTALSGLAALYLVYLLAQTKGTWSTLWEASVAAEREKLLGSVERRRAESERASLAAAVEQSAEVIVITGVNGDIRYCNPAFERLTGYSRAEVVGRNPRFLKSGEQGEEFYSDLWDTIIAGGTWTGRFVNRKKDGTTYQAEGTISPICDAGGALTGFVAATRDVTGRLRMEDQLRQAQKMEGIGRLAGGVAHDFNNLLTVIAGYSGLLEEKLRDQGPLLEYAQLISKASEHAAGLTRQLLAFSRKQIIKPRALDLNHVISSMRPMLQRLVGEDVEVCTDLGAGLGLVRGDADQMSQILVNLTANARDAMPEGGKLSIRTGNVDSALEGEGPEALPTILLEVSDTGVGMSTATQQNIFEPFFTTKERGRGTGLGLATVYGIVQQNDGVIKVTSSPGEGATFSIYLPRIEGHTNGSKETPARAPIRRSSETMLVVEDHEGVRSLIVGALAMAGYRVLQAASGAEALLQVQQYPHPIHMLITDVIMPGMTGKEVADRIADLRPGIKVLYISGYSGEVIAHRGVLDARVDYLPKPFTPDTLIAKVHEMLPADKPKGKSA